MTPRCTKYNWVRAGCEAVASVSANGTRLYVQRYARRIWYWRSGTTTGVSPSKMIAMQAAEFALETKEGTQRSGNNNFGVLYHGDLGRARRSDPTTSNEAAKSLNRGSISAICGEVMCALRASADGLTATEISERTGIERDTVSPRLPELVRARLVRDSGRKRKPAGRNRRAIVWESVND